MDITQYVLLGVVIAGATELISRLRAKDWWAAITIFTSALIGGVFGIFSIEGLDLVTGIAAGLGTSGSLAAVGMFGKKSTPAPSDPIVK